MARAAKVHCLEQGRDPRSYALVAFGGAAPVHAHRVAAALGMRHVLYPARAGVMSAFGFLVSPPAFELMRTTTALVSEVDPEMVLKLFAEMETEGRRRLDGAGVAPRDIRTRREAAIRYRGQTFDLLVPAPAGRLRREDLQAMEAAFVERYRTRYHRTNPGHPIEVVSWRVVVSGPRPDHRPRTVPAAADGARALKGCRFHYTRMVLEELKRSGDYGGLTQAEWIAARQGVEDIIGLDDYYRIERETVERIPREG